VASFHPLLQGAIELHIHGYPSIFPRVQDVWEIASDAEAAGMAGFVLKAHEWPTGPLMEAVQAGTPGLQVFGGLVCNPSAGGLNPEVVEAQLKCEKTKIVWMPTTASNAHLHSDFAHKPTKLFGGSGSPVASAETGLQIWNDRKELLPEVHAILDLIAERDAILATGHLSPEEVDVLVDAAIEHKISKILIQHVDVGIVPIPFEQQKRLAAKGAILEKCYLACTDFGEESMPLAKMADSIKQIGPESCVLVTDYGQKHNVPPVQALSQFVSEMLENGVSEAEISQMITVNPRRLLNL
jgi:hypothetical protein